MRNKEELAEYLNEQVSLAIKEGIDMDVAYWGIQTGGIILTPNEIKLIASLIR